MRRVLILMIAFVMVFGVSLVSAQTEDLYKSAIQHYRKGNFHKAEELLREYVKEVPDAEAYYLLGYCLYKQKRFDEASKYFKEAYLIDPNFSPTSASYFKKKHGQ